MKKLIILTLLLLTQFSLAPNGKAFENNDTQPTQKDKLRDISKENTNKPESSFNEEKINSQNDKGTGKNIYNLFNRTPVNKMRGLNTDRPDKTESAYTLDAGHFQFETDLITYVNDKNENEITKDFGFNVIN